MPTIDEFKNFQFVIAQIKEVKEHPNADRLYVITVDTGTEVKQLVAGIRKSYTPEQLIGRSESGQLQGLSSLRGEPQVVSRRFSSIAALADAMWSVSEGEVRSVDLRGTSILINLGRGDPQAVCRSKATLASGSGLAITQIDVSQVGISIRCPVSGYLMVQETSANARTASATVPADLVTIDARTPQRLTNAAVTARLRTVARANRIIIEAVEYRPGEVLLYYSQNYYSAEQAPIERLTSILMKEAPADIERFRLIPVVSGVPQRQFSLMRSSQERDIDQLGRPDILAGTQTSPAPIYNPGLAAAARFAFPRFSWSLAPQFRQQLFDPVNPFGVQLLLSAVAQVELTSRLSVLGAVETSLYEDYNTTRLSDSVLPHVRSDFVNYFSKGKHGLSQLQVDYRFRVAPDVFGIARAGYLESMFAGFGGELLWRPENQRWALGANVYQVWQRGFTRAFNLQSYNVLTGHVSLYYASPWYDLNLMLSAGRYLAGDSGMTVQVTRRFASGVEIGAFMTRTNVSAADFGEGSFDKGIVIRIPLDFVSPLHSSSRFSMDLRPIQRDGGQRLAGDAMLFEETRSASQAEMFLRSGGRVW